MRCSEVVTLLEDLFPAVYAAEGDATGVQIAESEDREISSIGVCYEVTEEVLEAARGCELLIAFHPLIYRPLGTIGPDDRVGRSVIDIVRSGQTLFVTHTRLDAHPRGSNRLLAERLGLVRARPLRPHAELADVGMGVIAETPEPMSWKELVDLVREVTDSRRVVMTDRKESSSIASVAMVAGSGMSYYGDAVHANVDAFITGDVKYHDFHASRDGVPIIDPGHAETETFVVEATVDIIADSGRLPEEIELRRVSVDTRPGIAAD